MADDRYILERVSTTGGRESRGVAFGLEGNLFIPAVFSVFIGIVIFLWLCADHGLVFSVCTGTAIPLLTIGFLKFFLNRKPPHYVGDWFESRLRKTYLYPSSPSKKPNPARILEGDEQ